MLGAHSFSWCVLLTHHKSGALASAYESDDHSVAGWEARKVNPVQAARQVTGREKPSLRQGLVSQGQRTTQRTGFHQARESCQGSQRVLFTLGGERHCPRQVRLRWGAAEPLLTQGPAAPISGPLDSNSMALARLSLPVSHGKTSEL